MINFSTRHGKYGTVTIFTICLNKEVVQQIPYAQIAFECCSLAENCCDASCKKKKCLPHVFEFDKDRTVAY